MGEEMKVMAERHVWHLVKLPSDTDVIGCRWVFTLKRDEKGKVARYKARLVAQGFKQVKGVSYEETFSPVINFSLIRFFFSLLVVLQGWTHRQCDVKGAYLYAPLKDNVYMSQPPGFVVRGKETLVCKLDRAIYGLHQSGREWFFEIHKVLTELGFSKLNWCNCAYDFNCVLILLLYVDDIVLFGKDEKIIDKAIGLLETHFDLKILGKTRKLLGVEFEEKGGEVLLSQSIYIDDIRQRFTSFFIPVSSLPISKGTVFSKKQCPQSDVEIEEMSHFPYRNLLGCLSFLAGRTRPDISYAVNIFSQYQSNPGRVHWDGLIKLLGYVIHTHNYKLRLACNEPSIMVYTDADFAANKDDRTSMGGQIVFFGKAPVMWRTFKEKCVSLSTMESEFYAMTEATKELMWFDRILDECYARKLVFGEKFKSILYVDNTACIDFVKSPVENHRSKHIDVRLFFIRDLVYQNIFDIKYIKSKENLADPFTKPLTRFELRRLCDEIFA